MNHLYSYPIVITTRCLLGIVLLITAGYVNADKRYPLEPVDTSSPRATLNSLLSDVDEVWRVYRDEAWHSPSLALSERIKLTAARALRTLDLSEVAPSARLEVGYSSATYLYETLSRIELPPLEEVPDATQFAEDGPARWTIPHTAITIARVTEGLRKGEFLFTPSTIDRSREFFLKTRDLPYRRDLPIEHTGQMRQVMPGWWVPMSLIEPLPSGLKRVVYEQAVWKWVMLLVLLAVLVLLVLIVHRLNRRTEPASPVGRYARRLVLPVLILVMIPGVLHIIVDQINMIGEVARTIVLFTQTIEYLVATWVAWLGSLLVAELIVLSPRIEEESLNAQLVRLTARITGIVLGLLIVFYGANQIGIPLVGVLAGVGVGGLAIALAAQDSLKNLLGSLMIFMDQPYKPGQRIVVEQHDGFVEQIGLRSTKIRMLSGALTSIPNEKMARLDIENIGRRKFIRRQTNIRLHNDTPVEKIAQAVAIIKDILQDHEGLHEELPPRVFFNEFNPDSLNIQVSYWYHPPRRWQSLAFDEKVNMEIMQRFTEADIHLAVPTSRTYLSRADQAEIAPVTGDGR